MSLAQSGTHRAIAVPLSLAAAAALAVVPHVASASPMEKGAVSPTAAKDGPLLSYVVNTEVSNDTIQSVERQIAKAGGKTVTTHQEIGVIVVHSANPDFAKTIRKARGVESAGATRTAPLRSLASTDGNEPVTKLTEKKAREDTAKARRSLGGGEELADEPLEALQWDLPAIKADQAHKVSLGSKKVTVAVIDTGVDDTHPDLAPTFDKSASANCVGGVADTSEGAWRPYKDGSYHGTHVAGTVAAARNGVGIAGVAPGVKVSSIKVSEPKTGSFFTEAVVCGFMFAAKHGIEVTNNSYYVDPWMFNCKDDPDQKALVDALHRAAHHAARKGVVHVAAAGNSNFDLAANEIVDTTSPNDTTPVSRTIDPRKCLDLPAQLPSGFITVSATGPKKGKAPYSNYGHRIIDVAAPGGDSTVTPDAPAADGQILSTLPGGEYGYAQGTSMASPHVAGVAALLKSAHPKASSLEIGRKLLGQADNPGCPQSSETDAESTQGPVCKGDEKYNSFYGHGIVDALDAVKTR